MSRVKKALFGGNIDPRIHNKLLARQKVAENAATEFESVQFVDLKDGSKQDFREALGTSNYNKDGMLLNELGSKTPWARLWTGVEVYIGTEAKAAMFGVQNYHVDLDETFVDNLYEKLDKPKGKGYRKVKLKDAEEAITKKVIERKVYIIGNHNYNRFQENTSENEPILRTELESNPFKKDLAGITQIESRTEGPLGTIKRTTVQFIVHNFNDYQKIYARYFLKPGAHVFLDFGWDTAVFSKNLYNPHTVINSGNDWRPAIYGKGQQLDAAAGDMETLCGKVTDFSSEVDENGSFICSLEFISDNAAVLDYEITEENKIRKTIIDNLGTVLINSVATNLGLSFLNEQFDTDPEQVMETENYANTFAQRLTTSGLVGANPSKEAVKLGIFYKGLITEELEYTGHWWKFWKRRKADVAIAEDAGLYVSWGFFEEELLNKYIARGTFKASEKYGGYFNSGMSWITYDNDLYNRQQIIDTYERNKEGSKFLYPPLDLIYKDSNLTELETYDTIHHSDKRKGKIDGGAGFPGTFDDDNPLGTASLTDSFSTPSIDMPSIDMPFGPSNEGSVSTTTINKIRLRELFINVKMIQEAMQSNETIQDALNDILNQLNEDSYGVFNLKFISSSEANDGVAIIDTNYYNSEFDTIGGYDFDDMFMFKPFQKGSIVKNVGLKFSTPEGGIANAIAVQNTPDEAASGGIYLTDSERQNDAIRKLYQFNEVGDNEELKIRHLPILDKDKSSDIANSLDANNKSSTIVKNVTDDYDASPITDQYKHLASQGRKIQEGKTLKREIDKDGYALDFDNKDAGALYVGLKDDLTYGNEREISQTTNEANKQPTDDPPDIIHPDARQKVVSYLLYLDNHNWDKDSIGGTDFWKVTDEKVVYNNKTNSMDFKYRSGRFSVKHPNVRLTEEEAERIVKFKSIDFKPNRLIGFVRNNKSYHSIPPRVLPNGVTRDCFQINIWNLRSRVK